MTSIYTIQSRLVSFVNSGLQAQWLHSFMREQCYLIISSMISRRTPQYEVHGLRSFVNGMLDLEYHRSYQRHHFHICKDLKWRCKGFYTYGNQPDLLTCTHEPSVIVFTYAYNIGDEQVRVLSVNQSELFHIKDIEHATGVPVAKIEYGLVGDKQVPMRMTINPDFNKPIISINSKLIEPPISRNEMVAGIKLN